MLSNNLKSMMERNLRIVPRKDWNLNNPKKKRRLSKNKNPHSNPFVS